MKSQKISLISISLVSIFLLISLACAEQNSANPSQGLPAGSALPDIPYITEIDPNTGNPVATQAVQNFGESISTGQWADQNNSYLRQELTKILEKNEYTAWIVKGYRIVYPYITPFFKLTIGMNIEWTWLFVLSFIIWCAFVIWFYRASGLISSSMIIRLILCLFGIIAITSLPIYFNLAKQGLPAIIGNLLVNFNSAYLWWVQLILVIMEIMMIILFTAIPKYMVQVKEAKDESKEKQEFKETEKRERAFLDIFSKGFRK